MTPLAEEHLRELDTVTAVEHLRELNIVTDVKHLRELNTVTAPAVEHLVQNIVMVLTIDLLSIYSSLIKMFDTPLQR